MGVFLDLWKQGSTLVVITPDLTLARRASWIVEIRDGRIVSDRPAEAHDGHTKTGDGPALRLRLRSGPQSTSNSWRSTGTEVVDS